MTQASFTLPRLITTSVVRGAQQGDSHGGIYLVDFQNQEVSQVVDWNTSEIDFTGRGWDRGLRGIAFFAGRIYVAASDELFIYDQNFRIIESHKCSYLRHCHEIYQLEQYLYLTSTGHDSVLAFDLQKKTFIWALHLAMNEDEVVGTVYDPAGVHGPGGAKGPPATNQLHLNNVFADERGLFVSGMRTGGLLQVASGGRVRKIADMPPGIHNARPYGKGILFNDTAANCLRYVRRDGSQVVCPVPQYEPAELTHLELGDDRVARQGFGRGLCVVQSAEDGGIVAAGSSPSTISLYDLGSGQTIARVNFSMDIRNAIHGLEVWPFDRAGKPTGKLQQQASVQAPEPTPGQSLDQETD